MVTFCFYASILLGFLFPWFMAVTIRNMIKGEKYDFQLFLSCISFGIIVSSLMLISSM